jgi:hypothetical protein
MTTIQDLIERTRQHVMTGMPDRINVLDASINDTVTTLNLRYELLGVADGSRLCIGTEEMHVLSKTGTAAHSEVTVIRGLNGSTRAAHTAGDIVRLNPHFSDYMILTSLNECILGLSGDGLYQVKPFTFTFTPSKAGYEITAADFLDAYKLTYDTPGPLNNWPSISRQMWSIDRSASVADFPSGKAIFLRVPGASGFPMKLSYKAGFTTTTDVSAEVTAATGLPLSSYDVPPLGAAIRLCFGRDIKRSFLAQQPEPRRQEEVPPGSGQQAIQTIIKWYYNAIDREIKLLHRMYPPVVS